MARALRCREVIEFLGDYLDGELLPGEREVFEAHLTECPDCVAYLESYRQTVGLGRLAFAHLDAPVLKGVPAELGQAVLAARPVRGRWATLRSVVRARKAPA